MQALSKMPKYPKIPTPGTVLNEFSSCARSNFLVWCRIRSRGEISVFGPFWVNLRQIWGMLNGV